MSDVMETFWRQPLIARTFSVAIFIVSISVYCSLLPFRFIACYPELVFQMPPHIWRPFTSFLLSLPQLSIILDPYFVFRYVSDLETNNPRFPHRADVVWYLMFVSLSIVFADYLFGWYYGVFLQGLLTALAYTGSQDQRGMKANFFFITIPAQLVPYSMMLVTLLLAGPYYLPLQLSGIVAAHLFDFLNRLWPEFGGGRNWIPTPAFLYRLLPSPLVDQRSYGTAFRPRGAAAAGGQDTGTGTATGASTGPLPDAWKTRGRGQRLGGD